MAGGVGRGRFVAVPSQMWQGTLCCRPCIPNSCLRFEKTTPGRPARNTNKTPLKYRFGLHSVVILTPGGRNS